MYKKFIIYAGGFDEKTGGLIALHQLCHTLNQKGCDAYLWPFLKPVFNIKRPFSSIRHFIRYFLRTFRRPYTTFTHFNTPLASYKDIKDAIIIYPEVTSGNPLLAKNVVRWFLHKPGFHTGKTNYGQNELYFFFQKAFNDPSINPDDDNLLQTIFLRTDIYHQINFGERTGTCYIRRKGSNRPIVHDLTDSILIDDLSHEEIAQVFNKVKYCISYDTYTMYSQYAALCGAISIIIPEEGVDKHSWHPIKEYHYGLAYGFDDIPYALETRPLLLPYLTSLQENADRTVDHFILKCQNKFSQNIENNS